MSGGPSNGSRSLATPWPSDKRLKAHNQHHLEPPAHQKRFQRNLTVYMRKIALETGISRESVRQIDKQELQLKPYKLQRVQLLTAENKRVRLERCRLLRREFCSLMKSYSPSNKPTITRTTEAVRRGSRHLCYRRAPPKPKVRDGLDRNLSHR